MADQSNHKPARKSRAAKEPAAAHAPAAGTSAVTEKLRETTDDLHELGAAVRGAAEDGMSQVRAAVDEYRDAGREYVRHYEDWIEAELREHPLRTLLIAAGVGAFGCLLLLRRRS
jgi:ElaB/YqjD/DUF883 family membrane-anchored ribosome-binding protein